jgi:hypothetical protein
LEQSHQKEQELKQVLTNRWAKAANLKRTGVK